MSKRHTRLAQRYAAALHKSLDSFGADPKRVAAELHAVAELWKQNSELSSSLVNPLFSKTQRKAALATILSSLGVSPAVTRFLDLVFARERITAIAEISAVFTQRVEQAAGIRHVRVSTARSLNSDEKRDVERSLEETLTGRIEYSWVVAPEILGGLIVEYDGRVLDGSVGGRLNRLERQLLG